MELDVINNDYYESKYKTVVDLKEFGRYDYKSGHFFLKNEDWFFFLKLCFIHIWYVSNLSGGQF
jgi:ABC-type enterochelin transport system ATPase subunit